MRMPFFHLQGQAPGEMLGDGRAQKPQSNITSPSQRETIKYNLTNPLHQMGHVAMAVRIVWKENEEMIWQNILSYRVSCDKFVKKLEGVAAFVSAITGTIGKSVIPNIRTPLVYPGISYWIVLTSPTADPRAIVRVMTNAFTGKAEIRLLKEPPVIDLPEVMHSTLCNVMKDHANGYVKQRVAACKAQLSPHNQMHLAGAVARVVSNLAILYELAQKAQGPMRQASVCVDIVHYDQT